MLGVYQEQQEGRRSEGRFRGLPGPPGTGRLQLPGRSRDIAGSRSAVGAPSAAWGPEGLPGWGHTGCACAGTRCCVLTPCPPSLRGLALAAQAAAPARPSPLGPRLSPEPPYARLSAPVLRAAGARGFPKMSVTLSWFRTAGPGAGGKDAVVSSGSYDAPPALAVPIPAGSSRCATGHVRIRQVQRSERCEVRPPPSRAGLGRIWVLFRQ